MALVNKRERRQRIQTIKEQLINLKVKWVKEVGYQTNLDDLGQCGFCPSVNQFNFVFRLRVKAGHTIKFLVCEECFHALNKLDWNMLITRKGVTL